MTRRSVPLPPGWLVSSLLTVALVSGFVWADREHLHWYVPDEGATSPSSTVVAIPAPSPDTVVGVVLKCSSRSSGSPERTALTGDVCKNNGTAYKSVTVRTDTGATYVVEVPQETNVRAALSVRIRLSTDY